MKEMICPDCGSSLVLVTYFNGWSLEEVKRNGTIGIVQDEAQEEITDQYVKCRKGCGFKTRAFECDGGVISWEEED